MQLRDSAFPRSVFDLLKQTGMRPEDLELEITEGILLEEASDAAEALRLFRSAGIKIALDDFGTGYSSLNYLKRYAEGVETHEQAKVLNDLGCNVYQGFLFSAPVTASAIEALMSQPRTQVA